MEFNPIFVQLNTQKVPQFVEKKNADWVFFGEDNLYADYLIELYQRSAIHNAIINGKVNYITGEGWTSTDKGVNLILKSKINEFLNYINEDEGIDELTNKITLDFELFNGFYLEVRREKGKNGFKLNHIPFNKIRTNKEMDTFYYSNDWAKEKGTNPEKTGFKTFPAFDGKLEQSVSIFYYKILSPRKSTEPNVYPIPNYIGGTQAVETDIECSNFNLSEIQTSFSVGKIINFYNGQPSEEERRTIKRKFEDALQGSEGKKWILNFADSKDRGSEVVTVTDDNLPERYLNVQKSCQRTIFTAHQVSSPSLFGVQQENVTFGSRAEIAEQYEIFQNTYVSPRQKQLEKVFNGFAQIKGIPGKLKIKPTKAIANDIFTEQTIIQMMPKEAIQEMIAERMGIDLSKYKGKFKSHECSNFEHALEGKGRSKADYEILESIEFSINDDDLDEVKLRFKEETPNLLLPAKPEIKPNTEILYSYEWRPEFQAQGDRLLSTSRDFCKALREKDMLYTESEIRQLRNDFGTSVWKYKGGWYTKPNTDIRVPMCRHIWKANLVKRK